MTIKLSFLKILFLLWFLLSKISFSPLYGQNYFQIIGGIPHLPAINPPTISSPENGMLVFSSVDAKPMIYTGTEWETLCTNNISASTPQDYFVVKNGIPFLPSLNSSPSNPQSGSIFYSIADKAVMIYNGTSWKKMVELTTGSITDNNGFVSGSNVSTYKLPVLNNNPSPIGLTAGAIYINSISKTIRYFDGTSWNDITCSPKVITLPITDNNTGRTATSGGNVIANGGFNVTLTGICWSPVENPDTMLTSKTKQIATGTGIGEFISLMTDLMPKTTYYVRAYAVNVQGIVYGDNVKFTTPVALPTIITLPADSITCMRAVSGGDIPDDGGSSVTKRGIIWSALGDPLNDTSNMRTDDGSGVGKFPSTLMNLLGNITYYVRAYAVNSAGTAYGNLIVFTTPPPILATTGDGVKVTNITGTTAIASSTVLTNGGASVTERGVCITTDHASYQCFPSSTVNLSDVGPFVVNLSGLTEGTTYYIKAYATNSVGTAYSSESSFNTAKLVNITTKAPSNLLGTTANSGGVVNDVGYSVITTRGICWDTLPSPTLSVSTKTVEPFSGNGTGSYTSIMTGLRAGKTYYVRAYAINAAGVAYGQQEQITLPDSVKVITLAASSLFGTTATVGGNVLSDGGSNVTDRGVCWSTNPNPVTGNSHTSDGDGLGMFMSILTNLKTGVVYHYRAFAKNVIGVSYGEDRTFTIVPEAPVIITLVPHDITSISAISGGNITSNGGAPITKRGILWSSTGDPVDDPNAVITNDGSGVGEFPSNLMNLLGNTTYYVRAYAVNAYGKSYGDLLQFTTPPPVLASIHPPTISQVTDTSAVGTFLILNNGGAPITARGLCYSTDGINYTYVPSSTTNINDIGTFIVRLTTLTPNTTYYVKSYAINSVGTAYSSQTSFKTTSLPVVTTTTPNRINGYDAYSGGTVLYVGDEKLQSRGICWSKDTIPTIALSTKTSEAVSGSGIGAFTSHLTGLTPSTKYYVRAYAINSFGIDYGNLDSLVTNSLSSLTTTRPSAMTSTSAVTGGSISDDGGCDVTSRGICWGTTPNPTTLNNHTTNGSGTGTFVTTLSNLMGSTKYYVRAYAINCVGVMYGNTDSLVTAPPVLPAVTTTDVINIGSNTATGRGYVVNAGGGTISERGICWNATGDPTIDDNHAAAASVGLGSFSASVTGLAPVAKYYMRAYAINEIGITYGEVIPFTTFTVATIVTSGISSVTNTTAKGGGQIISDGGTPVTSSGICWSTSPNPTVGDSHTSSGIGIGNFIHDMTGLMGSTTYYVRAYAINNAGTAYGQQETFTTDPPVLATVTTNPGASSDDGLRGTSGGTIVSNGGGVISTVGLVWSTSSGFSPDTVVINKSTRAGSGNFTSTISNLKPGTTYYVRAYVINSAGTSYATNEISFTTFDYPVVTTTAPSPSSISSVSVQTGGNVISNGGTTVTESGICWSVDSPPTIANDHISNGPGIGNFTRTITNLMGSTTYYVRAYAINSVGISYGSVESFTTKPPILASIETTQPYATSSTTGNGGGDITSNGGALVTTRGLVWSTVSGFNPDTVVYNKTATTGYFVGSFKAQMSGLKAETIYYVRAYVENSVGIAYGEEMNFLTPTLPTLTTAYATANGPTKGTTGGIITNDGGAAITTRGVIWSTSMYFDPDTVQVNKTQNGSGIGSFTTLLSGLKGNTTYYVIAYATNIAGTSYGNMLSFITDPATLASLTTREAWNISGTYAYSGGYISDNGGEPVTTRGILWSTKPGFRPDTVVVNKTAMTGSGNGNFTSVATGLKMGTTYYVRAYAINSIGIAYGNEISFTTLDIPTLTTMPAAAGSSGYNASGGGTLISDGGASITNQGVCWSTNHNPTVGLYTHTSYDPWAGNSFYSSMTDLKPVTTYYVRAYASNSQGVAYGDEVSFTTPVALPIITTNVVTATSKSTAATGGKITSDGGGTITAKGVIWSTNPAFNPDTVVVNRISGGTGSSNFTSIISGLQLSTAYYIRAYATNSAGTSYGNQVTITIFPTSPMLITVDPTAITGYTSTSGGIITSDGGADITQKGICWAAHTNPTIDDYKTNNGSGTDSYTANITNLLPNTLYYVRAYAINKIGVAYGAEKMILTNGIPVLSATFPASNIIATTATSGGEITDDGRSPILSRGICWSIYSNPTIALSTKTVDTTSHTIGSFFANMAALQPNTTYYVRAYATNAVGVGYGSEITFTTLPVMLPTLVTVKPYAIDSVAATSGGNIIDDGGMPVTVRGICWSTSPNPTTALATKINNATGGTGLYTNVIAGLSPGTKYYVRAYAINSKGTAYGNLDSLKTMAVKPTVSDVSMSNLTDSTGVSSATVIYDGGAPVTARGFCWNTTGNPTTTDNLSSLGMGIGAIKDTIRNLNDQATYYIRAYATNTSGTGYSPTITSFKICPSSFNVIHAEGLNGAAVSKTVTYHSISTNISGKAACWLTQNLGADRQATSVTEAAETAAGWYWQFNRIQGYQYTTARYPISWVSSISENTDWQAANDPCAMLLGNGWRIPTYTEWNNAKGAPQNWANYNSAYTSVLKLHAAGYLNNGSIVNRGVQGNHWTATQYSNTDGRYTGYTSTSFAIAGADANSKSKYAFTLRCLRDTVFISKPSVSNVTLLNMTNTGVDFKATVAPDGGAPVTARGFCWNTTGNPTISDNPIALGSGVGTITTTLSGLKEGPTYYVRAYAINSKGIAYSSDSVGFKICRPTFTVQHFAGLNGAPESKTVVYHSINSAYTGAPRCWITQNLGADTIAVSAADLTARATGWYWQFNRLQGYAYTTARIPATTWNSISETSDWSAANDPCIKLLGNGWRLPTSTEYSNVVSNMVAKGEIPYTSPLKMHYAGYLIYNTAVVSQKGVWGTYWSSTGTAATYASYLNFSNAGVNAMATNYKSYGFSARCLRDTIAIGKPSVSNVAISNMTNSTVNLGAAVSPDGGAPVTARGFCWNTTGKPTMADNVIACGDSLGNFTATMTGLIEGPTYYVRAYAINSQGTAYSIDSTAFKLCVPKFKVMHIAGLNGAPETKTVTYNAVSSTYSGAARCWITQNLGADSTATSISDASAKSAGWYWQFNRPQGYAYATARVPATTWNSISETSDWTPANDPCALLLGGGWRIPSSTEYANAVATMVTKGESPYASPLKMHYGGYIIYNTAVISSRGTWGTFWSSTATGATTASYMDFGNNGTLRMYSNYKWYGFSLRCLRDTIVVTAPSVSDAKTANMTSSTIDLAAIATPDGGAPVTARGFCWNTTGNPTTADHVIACGDSLGNFSGMITGLTEGPTYYVRAFATNKIGTGYSLNNTSFKICAPTFTVQHIAGVDGAPETKKVTYRSVSSNISGKAVCWLLQNLGADTLATAVTDATSKTAGWYWQFNHLQAYKHDGTTRTPATTWNLISETSNWNSNNDPCTRLLGSGWRLPSSTEWSTANAAPQNWANYNDVFKSDLKLHNAGYLIYNTGVVAGRGTQGNYWGSTSVATTTASDLQFSSTTSAVATHDKAYGFSLRCLRDTIVITKPSVGPVSVNTNTLTASSADASSSVASDGGATVTSRGICWNTTGNPTLANHVVLASSGGTGNFTVNINGIPEDSTYYVRAFATNSAGTAYSEGTGFNAVLTRICPPSFNMQHIAGSNGAPVAKTVTYQTVRSYLTGAGRCWIAQNLGADRQATVVTDATEPAAGWYFQFNNGTGYKHDGSTRTPAAWIGAFNEASDWTSVNDPCRTMLGSDWRIPTSTEWTTANGAPQNWTNYNGPFGSELKLHNAGYLAYNTAALGGRGTQGNYWSSTRNSNTAGYDLQFAAGSSAVVAHDKAYGFSVRCLRDGIVKMPPTLGNVVIADSTMTNNSAQSIAPLISSGGAPVTERGFCWNTTGNPTTSDSKIVVASADSLFNAVISSLKQGITYYIRAYAINKIGLSYSPQATPFKVCPPTFSVLHNSLLNGVPITKTVVYHSVNTILSGAARCWITQNLGADRPATTANDTTSAAAGWYWQFNRIQGYQYNNGSSLIPSIGWVATINESTNWLPTTDPCVLLLSNGWRMPTSTEWSNAITNGGWSTINASTSSLKLHYGGQIKTSALADRGSLGYYWSNTQAAATTGYNLQLTGSTGVSTLASFSKADRAASIRCLRDTLAIVPPQVSNVTLIRMTDSAAVATAAVTPDGGAPVTARGICWNSTGSPTIADNVIPDAVAQLGTFTDSILGLQDGKTYYIRAYATNSAGTSYSPAATSFKICKPYTVLHIEGLNGAPESKTIKYNAISTNISGKLMCWTTQNIGAEREAISATDTTQASAGWYWQFNRLQGYKPAGTSYSPYYAWGTWIAVGNENANWGASTDPCQRMLGAGWRLPTSTEWSNADANTGWTTAAMAYGSVLKLHEGGYMYSGALANRGSQGRFWSSTQSSYTNPYTQYTGVYLSINTSTSVMAAIDKAAGYAHSARCIRDSISLEKPYVTDVVFPTDEMTATTAVGHATVSLDGGKPVTERGFCWSTTNATPTTADNLLIIGSGVGNFSDMLKNLQEGNTYYIRAYATNSIGTGYSPSVTSFKICNPVTVIHQAGLNGAPEDKTVTYHSISTSISGAPRCWITQNLGASREATSVSDTAQAAAGWYWQFNRLQGYIPVGTTTFSPSYPWDTWLKSSNENADWNITVDPCRLLLGSGWRLPTYAEWLAVDAAPQYWSAATQAFNSVLKLHQGGYMQAGVIKARGTQGCFWSSNQSSYTNPYTQYTGTYLSINATTSAMTAIDKASGYAMSIRCLRDAVVLEKPSVTNVDIPTATMTANSAKGTANVTLDGGTTVSSRGFCWSTSSAVPSLNDSVMTLGNGTGEFSGIFKNLIEGPTYYVRAYATNSVGTSYSPAVTSFKICNPVTVIHQAGLKGAPEDKTVTYNTISTSVSGAPRCWITQNLGADREATSVTDTAQAAAGWYWQFNRLQGYKPVGGSYSPYYAWGSWIAVGNENADWAAANDPCRLLLGSGWRLPSNTEWTAVDAAPQYWSTAAQAFSSVLKLHEAGYMYNGAIANRGVQGRFWSATQSSYTNPYTQYTGLYLLITASSSAVSAIDKAYGYAHSVRCLRDTIALEKPSVTNVVFPTSEMKATSATGHANVSLDGGKPVTARGFCWSTTNTTPTTADNVLLIGNGTGDFSDIMKNLQEGITYYVRAYATNSVGTGYSPSVTSFKICNPVTVIHQAGLNGSPEDKTVVYNTISTSVSGAPRCWITQNLGADREAISVSDTAQAAAGWYWQFNRLQGYIPVGTTTFAPSYPWDTWLKSSNENSDWAIANDPCRLLLGSGWRLPTYTEWLAVDAAPQYWSTATQAFNSELKLHMGGYMQAGVIKSRGSQGSFWSSTQSSYTNPYTQYTGTYLSINASTSAMTAIDKASGYGQSVRCLRDAIVLEKPSVTVADIPTSTMTANSAKATANVTLDGGASVTARGFCWSSTSTSPSLNDSVMTIGNGTGIFSGTFKNLIEGPTYYVRAYATNSVGTTYSPAVTSFKICNPFTIIHQAGLNGAPEDKTVTYHTISTSVSGDPRCWITQNLGADREATAVDDADQAAAGWYWQFNRLQGYVPVGTTSFSPSYPWDTWLKSSNENGDWATANDPCRLLLGSGWRLPTYTEWYNVDDAPQYWSTATQAFKSVLKLHQGGYMQAGVIKGRGSQGSFWSSNQASYTNPYTQYTGRFLSINATTSGMTTIDKASGYANSVRCLRDAVILEKPSVTVASIPTSTMTANSAKATSNATLDGGTTITTRGFCWSATNATPSLADNVIPIGNGTGEFSAVLSNLTEGPTYYVRAYATNSVGTTYSQTVTSFKICNAFTIIHQAGLNGAPEDKTVTYHTISTSVSGAPRCWITQNLGADREATAVDDASQAAAGWYWQFNRYQGYVPAGSSYSPYYAWGTWLAVGNENANWSNANDPCQLLIGSGWRMPTYTEWYNVDDAPQYWSTATLAFNSVLKLHESGYIYNGALANRGVQGRFWSSTQSSYTNPYTQYTGLYLSITATTSAMAAIDKGYGYAHNVRCLRDTIVLQIPSVTKITFPTTEMGTSTAIGHADVTLTGGKPVVERGFCWSITNAVPSIADNIITLGSDTGKFTGSMTGLVEGTTYYVRAYARNSVGVGYSPAVTSFKICNPVTVTHQTGVYGAPEDKTVTYHTISTSISGAPRCWTTQNLGADKEAAVVDDTDPSAAGWYWQFNRIQGYATVGSSYTPYRTTWVAVGNENANWSSANDPCQQLGPGWRMPTSTEWTTVDAAPQYWQNAGNAFSSELKLHEGGYIYNGALANRGVQGRFWSATQSSYTNPYTQYTGVYLLISSSASSINAIDKASGYAHSIRCLRDTIP